MINGLNYLKEYQLDFKDFNLSCFVNNMKYKIIPNSTLWHICLGHAQNKCIKILSNKLPYDACNEHICDVCHYSKQRKLLYVCSDINANNPFDLIHGDIWGPFSLQSRQH